MRGLVGALSFAALLAGCSAEAQPSPEPMILDEMTEESAALEDPPQLEMSAPALTFHGDSCTQDCSGHEAGYEWAEEQGITDPYECGGKSDSFIEGCEAYAEEQLADSDDYSADY